MRRDCRHRRGVVRSTTSLIFFGIMRRLGRLIRDCRFVLDQCGSSTSCCFSVGSCEGSFSCLLEKMTSSNAQARINTSVSLFRARQLDCLPPFHAQTCGDTRTKFLRRSTRPRHPLQFHRQWGLSHEDDIVRLPVRISSIFKTQARLTDRDGGLLRSVKTKWRPLRSASIVLSPSSYKRKCQKLRLTKKNYSSP